MSLGNLISDYMEGANYRRLKQSLKSQRATEQNTDDMLRLSLAETPEAKRDVAARIIADREQSAYLAAYHRRNRRNTFLAVVAALVGLILYGLATSPKPDNGQILAEVNEVEPIVPDNVGNAPEAVPSPSNIIVQDNSDPKIVYERGLKHLHDEGYTDAQIYGEDDGSNAQ